MKNKLFNLILVMLIASLFAYFVYAAVDSVSLDSPEDNYWSNSANVSFNCTATMNDSEEIPANVSLYIGLSSANALTWNVTNTSAVSNATAYQFDVTNIPDGNYTWTCYAANESGSITTATSNKTLYVDTTVPNTITLNAPANNNYSSGRNLTFNWTVSDNLDLNLSCNLSIDGTFNLTGGYGVANGSNGVVMVYNIPDGTHTWSVTCLDEALNSNTSATRNFTVDLSNPSVTLSVSNLTWFSSGTSLILNATVTDSSLKQCELYGDFNGTFKLNQTINGTSGNNNFAGINLPQGTYKYNVKCNDTFSKNASASTNNTFYVDLTNPSASVSLSATSISTYGAVTITCGATDTQDSAPTSGGPSVSLPDGTVSADTDGTFSDTVASGTYTATCTATDASGRTASTSSTFTVSGVSSSGSSSSSGVVSSTKETHTVTLSSNPVTIKISKPNEMGINEIELTAKEEISNVKFSVEKFSGKPADVDKADGEVLYYLNIDAPMAQGKLKQAKIRFDVSKKWMDDKNIGSSEIVMMKFTDKWVNLKTSEIGGTADAKTFEAITSGFSFFVITIRTQEAVEEVEEVQKETKPAVVSKEAVDEVEGVEKGSKGWLLVTVIILALVMVGVLLYSKKDWLMNLMPRKDDDGVNKALRRRISRKLKK